MMMKEKSPRWKHLQRYGLLIAGIAVIVTTTAFYEQAEDLYFQINRSIDLFGKVYRELALNYVDELNPDEMMESGIRGMLSSLDPYTVFIDEDNKGDVEMLTTGRYGGIGISVGVRDGKITITAIMDGYSAEREGLRIGDRMIEIDGINIVGKQTDEIRRYIRGEPGTIIKLKIERPSRPEPFELSLKREEIILKNVTYAGMIQNDIGYIKLDRFSRRAGEDVREALKELEKNYSLKGIILDLRDNPGGLLDAAVDVVEKFVPKGSLIVSTKGRKPNASHEYKSEEDPLYPSLPLIVLINQSSASASEIVAGAMQDLDRGVLLGTRTFGKGLVQSVAPLSYNASLKITTSRYYTPSGRCIQEIDYSKKDSSKKILEANHADSLHPIFYTLNLKRKVFEAGGITPDTVIEHDPQPKLLQELTRKGLALDFIAQKFNQQEGATREADENMLKEFRQFLEQAKFEYRDETMKKYDELLTLASKEKYSEKSISTLKGISKQLEGEAKNDFEQFKNEITRALNLEIVTRNDGSKGRIKMNLQNDKQIQSALALLGKKELYERILRKPH